MPVRKAGKEKRRKGKKSRTLCGKAYGRKRSISLSGELRLDVLTHWHEAKRRASDRAANNPKKAQEIITGGLNTLSPEGVVVMESTPEGGKRGRNYELQIWNVDDVFDTAKKWGSCE